MGDVFIDEYWIIENNEERDRWMDGFVETWIWMDR